MSTRRKPQPTRSERPKRKTQRLPFHRQVLVNEARPACDAAVAKIERARHATRGLSVAETGYASLVFRWVAACGVPAGHELVGADA